MIIALTTVMLVALLTLVPIRARVNLYVDLKKKVLFVYVNVFFIWIFKEKFTLQGKYLQCRGTIDSDVDLFDVDSESGKNIVSAIVFDSVNINFAVNYAVASPYVMVGLESVVCAVTAVVCAISNCNVHVSTQYSPCNAVLGEVRISVSIAELLCALVKNSIRERRKARRLKKASA